MKLENKSSSMQELMIAYDMILITEWEKTLQQNRRIYLDNIQHHSRRKEDNITIYRMILKQSTHNYRRKWKIEKK